MIKVNSWTSAASIRKYPILMMHVEDHGNNNAFAAPLVVLFTSETTGVALSGVMQERIGIPETWKSVNDTGTWYPLKSIEISNE